MPFRSSWLIALVRLRALKVLHGLRRKLSRLFVVNGHVQQFDRMHHQARGAALAARGGNLQRATGIGRRLIRAKRNRLQVL